MADIYELEADLADPNSSVLNDMFIYFHTNRAFGRMTEGQARIYLEGIMQDHLQRDTLLASYLPVYNQNLQKRCTAQNQATQVAQATVQTAESNLRNQLTKATVVGATGLIAIVLSPMMEPESARKAVSALGSVTLAASGLGAGIVYVKHLLR